MTEEFVVPGGLVSLKEKLASNPGVILEVVAERWKVSMAQAVESLPETMWKRIDGNHFVDVLEEIAKMGPVTVVVHTPDAIFEIPGNFPQGAEAHGFYNLSGKDGGLHGHLKPKQCGSIYFVERPFMNRSTASIQFMNQEGNGIFKVFLGRNEQGEIRADQLALFHQLSKIEV